MCSRGLSWRKSLGLDGAQRAREPFAFRRPLSLFEGFVCCSWFVCGNFGKEQARPRRKNCAEEDGFHTKNARTSQVRGPHVNEFWDSACDKKQTTRTKHNSFQHQLTLSVSVMIALALSLLVVAFGSLWCAHAS